MNTSNALTGRSSRHTSLEPQIQRNGRRLLATLGRNAAGDPKQWLSEALMGVAMGSEAQKTALLQFVDVLPTLKTSDALTQHLEEYLLRPGMSLPLGASRGLALGVNTPMTRPLLAAAVRHGVSLAARRFIAGATAPEAAAAAERLRRLHLGATFDLLGEAVTSEAEALAYQKQYLDLIPSLAAQAAKWRPVRHLDAAPFGPVPRVNVSVKLSALTSRFSPMAADATAQAVKERLRPILSLARRHGAFVNVDMEQNSYVPISQRIFQEVLCEPEYRDWADIGIVVQAYRTKSAADLEALRDWVPQRGTPVWVRLVKGAYWDYETIIAQQRGHPIPVYQDKAATDANFERLSHCLIENWQALRPALATHNVRSAAHAQALASALKLPPGAVEYQVLLGMGEPLGRALAARGERVRVYVPFGELLPGMAYLVRRLLENTSNESFLRGMSRGRSQIARLLAPPAHAPAEGDHARIAADCGGTPQCFVNEPETDFDVPGNQRRMVQALAQVRAQLGESVPVVINGRRELAGALVERRDPSDTRRVVARVSYATPGQAERAVAAATAAFPAWRDVPISRRSALLRRTADALQSRRLEIAGWQVYEVGKPWRDADADVAEAIDFCRFYAAEMERLAAPRRRDVPGETNQTVYDARGPAVIIAPWNFPLAILTGMATAALVAGNPVVLKPAEQSSRSALFLLEALEDAGVPDGVVSFLPGDGEALGPTLIAHPNVALVAFTGSKANGLSILRDAAVVQPGQREIRKVIAELGGKNVVVVDEDADLDEAVTGVLNSAIGFSGQKCSACSRVVVVGSAYEPFCARLAEAVRSVPVGAADDPATALGPVVDEESRRRVEEYLKAGHAEGRLLAQTPVPQDHRDAGHFVAAAAFVDCPTDGRLWREEIFGPVMAIHRAESLDKAFALAADSQYALTGGLYSRSPRNIERARREFRVGNLYINRKITGALVDRQPFGGAAMSGVGAKAGGPDYLLQFLTARTITESVLRRGFAPVAEAPGAGI